MKLFDCHSDAMADIRNKKFAGESDILRRYHLPLYKKGEVLGLIYALWIDPDLGDPQKTMFETLAASFAEFDKCSDSLGLAKNTREIRDIAASGKTAVMLGIEGFDGFKGDMDYIHMMYHLGFRHGMLTWNGDNAFAAGALHEGPGDGLTGLGRAAVREMESLGMIVDVSHASEKTFWNIVDATERPFIASHSNAYSLCPSRRNLKDGQLKALAERGGVVGMNICGSFIDEKEPSVALLARHADYIANLVGIDHVCCGFDFCGYLNLGGGFDDDTPGIHNHSECQSFIDELEKLGYSQEDIEKVAYKNIFSLMDKLLK